ncbi:MAG TPA: hypothetical protein DHV48_10390 [Prolixibacteraceae bacterium]|nr:hypothetical protein [Prolixibacteraceae bacterium]
MKNLSILILALLVLSCTKNKINKEHYRNSTIISVPVTEEIFPIKLVSDKRFLPLESKKINKISSINKITFFNNKILILDKQQNKILLFDSNGKYLSQINYEGKGPNEYLYLSDFIVNKEDNSIELLDRGNRKILKLNDSNLVTNELKFSFYCDRFLKTKKGEYLFFTNNQTNKTGSGKESYNLILTDEKAKIINHYLQIPPEKEELIISESHSFTPYKLGVNFTLPIDNQIYYASGDTVGVKYQISFGKCDVPDDILTPLTSSHQGNKIQLQMKLMNKITQAGYAYNIHSVLENDSFLFFQFRKGMNVNSVLYAKKTKNIKTGVTIINNIDTYFFGQPVAINDKNELITILFPYELHDRIKSGNLKNNSSDSELEKLITTIGQFDNPIIQSFKLSDF